MRVIPVAGRRSARLVRYMRRLAAVFAAMLALTFAPAAAANQFALGGVDTASYGASAYGLKATITFKKLIGDPNSANCASGSGCYVLANTYLWGDQGSANYIEAMLLTNASDNTARFVVVDTNNGTGCGKGTQIGAGECYWDCTSAGACDQPAGIYAQPNTDYAFTTEFNPSDGCCGWKVTLGPYTLTLHNVMAPMPATIWGYAETVTYPTAIMQVCADENHLRYKVANGDWVAPTSGHLGNDGGSLTSAWSVQYTNVFEKMNDPGCSY